MSQFFVNQGGSSGPTVPTQFTTDDGTAIPSSNNLNVLGGSGIDTYANPDMSENLYIEIKNSCTSTGQTIGAVTDDLCTTTLSSAGTYTFDYRIAAWETGGTAGSGYSMNATVRSDGVTATLIGTSDGFIHEDASLVDADVQIIVSGNDAILRVTGVAGLTINWGAFSVYIFRGA